ncbi:chain-length determining protein [Pseudarthrobacter sp. NIBRBAC000502771]|uniref:chain-length determining protein n=1 Tax=Pseudarthrobacter sp. NIBRBAC000502771 TaxID=2590774 RepID=UPI001131EE58|nr:chain-length determining protein [Pseudarthrobacter sp. NIBRBAC000502771]QDG61805.1 chain-length determining protein [Pseudarthrobacter sp. NIBRBAC000502771]
MDPLSVIRVIMQYKLAAIPAMVATLIAAVYVFQFAPRSFESNASYAIINPNPPAKEDALLDPALGKLNSDNPYLRSSDPTLIVQVVMTDLNSKSSADLLEGMGLGTDYSVTRYSAGNGSGFVLDIAGRGTSPEESSAVTRAVGDMLQKDLYRQQKVNGADDRYLYTSIVIAQSAKATEQFSSRLRSVIVVILGGVVLTFASISVARSVKRARTSHLRVTEEESHKHFSRDGVIESSS